LTRASVCTYGFFAGFVDVDVVFVCPGAVALFPCVTVEDGFVFVCPGAVALFPCVTVEDGFVFVCPGAVALFPCVTVELPGAC
jgi:hypothetical protein